MTPPCTHRAESEEHHPSPAPPPATFPSGGDSILTYPAERKALLASRRAELAEESADAEANAQLADTILRLRQKLPVERETLLAAARRHMELRQKAGAEGEGPALPPAGGGTPRRIVQ